MLLLATLLLACQPSTPLDLLEACGDQACRTAALMPAWQADPEGTRSWLAGLSDPTVQATLIEGLALEHPDEAATLCRELPEGNHARVRCERRVVRPHLEGRGKPAQAVREAGRPQQASAQGPRNTTLPLLAQEPPPWIGAPAEDLRAALEGCEESEPVLCGRLVSREHAAAGRWEQAGTACLAGDPATDKAYAECLFQAAEVLAESRGAEGLGDTMRLCSWSSYGPMCVAHALTRVGPQVPGADALEEADILGALAVVEALRRVSEGQPELQATWVDRYWSSWTYTVYTHARTLDDSLAARLPQEARPHLSVAIAARLLQGRDPNSLELEALVAELEAVPTTAQEPALGARTRRNFALVTNHRIQTWASDRKEEQGIPSAWVMGPARRGVATDPTTDLRICILEAAAQLRTPPPASFFLQVVGDKSQHRLVRWTGARIGSYLDPDAASTLEDPEPLVQQALDRPRLAGGAKGKPPPDAQRRPRPVPGD